MHLLSKLFIFLTAVSVLYVGRSTDYYIDYSTGSDSNTGTSTSTPWKHVQNDTNATGTAASTVLVAGDTLNFKGGVIYYGHFELGYPVRANGTVTNPIIVRTAPSWGTGNAVIDSGAANVVITASGDYQTYSGLTITNFHFYGFQIISQSGIVVSNCLVDNGVKTRENPLYGLGESAVQLGGGTDCRVVSNIFRYTGQKGIGIYGGAPQPQNGVIIWGNDIYGTMDDTIQMSATNYIIIAYNKLHDATNSDNSIGAHSDAAQILDVPLGSRMVFAFNAISNINGGGLFYEPNAANNNGITTSSVTNVINLVSGTSYQVCTNSQYSLNPTPSIGFYYNGTNFNIGQIFKAGSIATGYWNSATHYGFLKRSAPNGTTYHVGNTVEKVQYQGIDACDDLEAFWSFNNTYTNCATPMLGSDARDYQTIISNQYFFNELSVNMGREVPMYQTPDYVTIANNVNEHSGWNIFTADNLFNDTPLHATSFAAWKATFPTLEVNSVIGSVAFTGPGDFRVVSGGGIGTNLYSVSVTASNDLVARGVPLQYIPNLSKDAWNNQRPAVGSWNVGAFQGTNPVVPYYTITQTNSGNGTVSPTGTVNVYTNTTQLFTSTPNSGYTTVNWVTNGVIAQSSGNNFTSLLTNFNYTVGVSFTPTSVPSSTQWYFIVNPNK